jgi:pimeloyl-ACP methyl ester carboxylesterase
VDGSGWKPVYQILTRDGYNVTMVQVPETSFPDDVAATKRIIDLQSGPCILVGHSYGGSIITEAGLDPHVVGLVYVAAHAPDVGEDEGALGKGMPSVLAKTKGAIEITPENFTYLNPGESQALRARSAARASPIRVAITGPGGSEGLQHTVDRSRLENEAELGHCRRVRPDHQSRSREMVLQPRPQSLDRSPGRQPLRL